MRHACDMEKKDVRVPIVMGQAELDALDEWRAEHKIWSRGEAIRRVIAEGIKRPAEAKPTKP